MSKPNWLPEEYKAPKPNGSNPFLKSSSPAEAPAPQASPLVGGMDLSKDSLVIPSNVLTEILRETRLCQQYFVEAAKRGFKRYETQATFNNGQFVGIKINLQK